MRVLHVTAFYAPAFVYGGPPRSIHGLCRALHAHGVDIEVLATDANGREALPADVTKAAMYDTVPVRYFPRSWPAVPVGSRALAAALPLAVDGADLIHIHGLWNRVVWAAAREARRAGVPFVLSPRGMLEGAALRHRSVRKRIAWTLIERATIEAAAMLHATSDHEYDTLRALRPGADIALVPNGVDVPVAAAAAVREPLVVFIGRLHPIKRLDLLIAAFAKLRATGRNVRLVVAGPDEAGLRDALAISAGPAASAITWPGAVDANAKSALLARASAAVMCSDSESFGLSVAEAMAAGVPVVVTRTCPWADVERHRAGFWVEHSADAIAAALGKLLDDPAEARAMGLRGRALIEQKYRWPSVAGDLVRHYSRVIQARSRVQTVPCAQTS
jgi:glycosyltransferase involved in cell wall biosynthesis